MPVLAAGNTVRNASGFQSQSSTGFVVKSINIGTKPIEIFLRRVLRTIVRKFQQFTICKVFVFFNNLQRNLEIFWLNFLI